jgi:hypothetical protein
MAGIGPAPKPDGARRRRNATVPMTQLPAEGRQGDPPPPWPIENPKHVDEAMATRQLELWAQLWATPQAVQWERNRWTVDVALYVRWTVLAEQGSLDAGKEARMLSDRLGLTPLAMLRLRWEVVEDELAARRPTTGPRPAAAAATRKAAVRKRVKAVDTK